MRAEEGGDGAVSGFLISVCLGWVRREGGIYLLVFKAEMKASRVGEVSRMMVKRVERGPL